MPVERLFTKPFMAFLLLLLLLPSPACSQEDRIRGDGLDDALRLVPVTAVYALKLSGVEGSSSWKRLLVNTAASYALAIGSTSILKSNVHSKRPDMSDDHSFPSGHAAVAFAGAHQLHKEYGKVSPWISVAGYGVAVFTACDRVGRNRHWWADVLAGGAIGVASTELGYLLGDLITGERSRYRVAVSSEGVALAINL